MLRDLPKDATYYCPTCNCTRQVTAVRRYQKRKTGKRVLAVEVVCKHCRDRVGYSLSLGGASL